MLLTIFYCDGIFGCYKTPEDTHWGALERVMRQLKGTVSYGIHYSGHPKVLEGYNDANWISDADELYATSG
jgi:hypothetical protein